MRFLSFFFSVSYCILSEAKGQKRDLLVFGSLDVNVYVAVLTADADKKKWNQPLSPVA